MSDEQASSVEGELRSKIKALEDRLQYKWLRYESDGSMWRAGVLETLTVEQCDAIAATICPYCRARLPESYVGEGGPQMAIKHHIAGADRFYCKAQEFRDAATHARMLADERAEKQ